MKCFLFQKSGSISATPNEPSIKEDDNESGEFTVSNGDSGIAESAATVQAAAGDAVETSRGGEPEEVDVSLQQHQSGGAATVAESHEKKEEKYVNELLKVLLGRVPDVFGAF